MPHNYDVAMDTGDHISFTWILYVYYVCVQINIFVYTFRYEYPKKLNWLPWKQNLKYMILFRKFVNIQKISEHPSYIPLMLILLPTF